MNEKLYLGVEKAIITPKVGTRLFGYAEDLFSNQVHDDLHATVFLFEQGDVDSLDGGKIMENAFGDAFAYVFQEFGSDLHLFLDYGMDVGIADCAFQFVGFGSMAEVGL